MATLHSKLVFFVTAGQLEALESLALNGRVSRFSDAPRNPYLSLETKGLVDRGAGYDNWSLTQFGSLLLATLSAGKGGASAVATATNPRKSDQLGAD